MLKENINIPELCQQFENALLERDYGQDSMYRYRKILKEFSSFVNGNFYSPEIGADFLTQRLTEMGGFVNTGRHSKSQLYYIRTIRSLEAYYLFGTFFRRRRESQELMWPEQFRRHIESYMNQLRIKGVSDIHIAKNKNNFRCFILYLNKFNIHSFSDVRQDHLSGYITSLIGFAPKTIVGKISVLRGLFKYLYLNEFIGTPLADGLRIGMHSLRHSLASELLQNNVELNTIADILGHSDPETTRHYLSVNLRALRQCPLKVWWDDNE